MSFDKDVYFEKGDSIINGIRNYLSGKTNKSKAFKVYEAFLETYKMPGLNQLFNRLRTYEENVAETIPKHRDHYLHSVEVFILGLALYCKNETISNSIDKAIKYKDSYHDSKEEFLYRWGLTALFHDIGYPVELLNGSLQQYASFALIPAPFNTRASGVDTPPEPIKKPVISFSLADPNSLMYVNRLWPKQGKEKEFFSKYPELKNEISTDIFELIGGNLSRHFKIASQKTLASVLRSSLLDGLKNGNVDHGLYSAIVMIKWINSGYIASGWNPAYFYQPVIDAGAAIALHNCYRYLFLKYPFNLSPLPIDNHPLAWLLILCDSIQEADREEY
ncbi:MAG: hypothetical protein GY847_27100 [Proteobacteria bacterium]|nr:hypothetical protein [Pseudomonadota bacterium]